MIEDKISDINPELNAFLQVHCEGIPIESPVIDALIEAIKIINSKIRIDKKYHVLLGRSPFQIPTVGTLTYNMEPCTVGIVIEHFIFIDYSMLIPSPPYERIAIILEELVHALMNVTVHPLAPHIVCLLYPCVTWDDVHEKYVKRI